MPRKGFGSRGHSPRIARELRCQQTGAEETLWELLRGRRLLGLKFRRQFPVGPFVADFCCYDKKLIVELDGEVHSTTPQKAHDQNRDSYLVSLGYKILRFPNHLIHEDPDSLLGQIARSAGLAYRFPTSSPSPSPGGREGMGEGAGG